ncbi:MAG: hypothetical protein ACKVX7_12405 [Planctomycetota bacterium]
MSDDRREPGRRSPRACGSPCALSIFIALVVSLPAGRVDASDFWPLVNHAEGAVWGVLTEVIEGDQDRLLVISGSGSMEGHSLRGVGTFHLLERGGQLPEGMPLVPGTTSLFLFTTAAPDAEAEFTAIDGLFVPGGLIHADGDPDELSSVDMLVAAQLARAPINVEAAFSLLDSPKASLRQLALTALASTTANFAAAQQARLGAHFNAEADPVLLTRYLEIFLLNGWALAEGKIAALLIAHEASELHQLSYYYLSRLATNVDRAGLLAAYPHVDAATRRRLLESYATLGLAEADAYFRTALLSDDIADVECSLEAYAMSGLPAAESLYGELLASKSAAVRRIALRGLATIATSSSAQRVRSYLTTLNTDDPMRSFVVDLLKHPFRHGRVRIR